jgi:hypothetical protein
MHKPRVLHTATLLPNGLVILIGGGDPIYYPDIELYDPDAGTFSPGPPLLVSRSGHTSTWMLNEFVLILGGTGSKGPTTMVEMYRPADGKCYATNDMPDTRSGHTATLLRMGWAGKVLIAGGVRNAVPLDTAELYDTASQQFTATGSLKFATNKPTATLLSNGNVLIAGGLDRNFKNLAGTQIYNSALGSFTVGDDMAIARGDGHTATLLGSKNVLITGGRDTSGAFKSAELYDVSTATFRATADMTTPRWSHTATLLSDGRVLIAGGWTGNGVISASAEIYEE